MITARVTLTLSPQPFRQLKVQLGNNLERATKLLHTRIKRAISVKVVRLYRKKSGGTTLTKGSGRRTVYVQRSKPGEPPRRDTGKLLRATKFKVNRRNLEAKVFNNTPYGPELEFGSSKILPRPAWRPVFNQSWRTMLKIIQGRL